MSTPFLPIVYVRGYASFQSEVEETTDDPFNGFNLGSTHIRVGAKGEPDQFYFESPVVRLMTDYGYIDAFDGRNQSLAAAKLMAMSGRSELDLKRTIWIHRYYDKTSKTFNNDSERLSVEDAARRLAELIERIYKETTSRRVHLVAHSMGGLVCRSLIQKIYPDQGIDPKERIGRFFTYGTPHGGIEFRSGLGFVEWIRDTVGFKDSDNFGRKRMYEYLTPEKELKLKPSVPDGFNPRVLTGIDIDNVFNVVGTNAKDYLVAKGASKFATGAQGDGLVQMDCAAAISASGEWAHRAYVHRSHSGRYGMVNSEEAFLNLERFLFGTIQSMMSVGGFGPLRPTTEKSIQMELRVAVRGLPVWMHERTRANWCPIVLNDPAIKGAQETYPLYTTFLNGNKTQQESGPCKYALEISLYEYDVKDGKIDYSKRLHGMADWDDILEIEVQFPSDPALAAVLNYSWAGQSKQPAALTQLTGPDGKRAKIPLPVGAAKILGPAYVLIDSYAWTLD